MFEETGKLVKIQSYLKFMVQDISDLWDAKILEKSKGAASTIAAINLKKQMQISIDQNLNVSVPYLNIIKKSQKPDSIFEMVT